MRISKTHILIIILILLVGLKFLTSQPESKEKKEIENLQIIDSDITKSDIQKPLTIRYGHLDNISLLYVVVYDHASRDLIDSYREDFERRAEHFDTSLSKASLNRMYSESEVTFLNIEDIGGKKLEYDRSVFDWIKDLKRQFSDRDYDVIAFVPIYEMPWCQDGPSQGFNYQGDIYFCMETYHNPVREDIDKANTALMIHKILHGVGYNHQTQVHKQYVLRDWSIGLPETNGISHGTVGFGDFENLFFNQHTMKVLNLSDEEDYEKKCLDSEQFVCKSKDIYYCEDSWGPFCSDSDKDGVVDSEDEYVFSSPLEGPDSDSDGIIDRLDLCPDNEIKVISRGAKIGVNKIKSKISSLNIRFESSDVEIEKVSKTPMKMVEGFISFPGDKETVQGNKIRIISNNLMWRLEVYYSKNGEDYYRPYYVYFPGFDANYVHEREWYYYNRLGCDIPAKLDFKDIDSYDQNRDGLLDNFNFSNYDWDGDGFRDTEDTLPTVEGDCSNNYVRGVKDSDQDGLCDPGQINFENVGRENIYNLNMEVNNPGYDREPYIKN